MMKASVILAALLAGGVLAACSSVPYAQHMRERQAAYAAAAGAPVRHFDFFTLYSWESLEIGRASCRERVYGRV